MVADQFDVALPAHLIYKSQSTIQINLLALVGPAEELIFEDDSDFLVVKRLPSTNLYEEVAAGTGGRGKKRKGDDDEKSNRLDEVDVWSQCASRALLSQAKANAKELKSEVKATKVQAAEPASAGNDSVIGKADFAHLLK